MDSQQQEKSCTSDIELEQFEFGPQQGLCSYQQSKVNNHFLSPSEVYRRIDGFATISGYDLEEEENIMNNIQINTEFKDFHLEKMFDEHSRFFQESQLDLNNQQQNQPKINHNEPKVQQQYQSKSRKGSQQLPSFQDLLDRMIENFIDSFNPQSFQEYNRFQEAMGNIDNFIFLEQSLQFPYVFKNFIGHYMRFIEKMKQYRQQGRLDFKQMIAFVCSMGLEYIQDVLNVIKKCDNSYCFQILKQDKEEAQGFKVPQKDIKQESESLKQIYTSNSFEEPQKINKNLNNHNEKSSRKNWSEYELQMLEDFINNNNQGSISQQQIQQLSQQLGRSVYSVQSKLQKMRKQDQNSKSIQFTQ